MDRPVKRLLQKHTWQNPEISLILSCQTAVDFSVFTVCVMGLVVDKILNSFQSLLIKILPVWVISNWQNARTDIWVAVCWFYISVLVPPSCGRLVPNTLKQTETKQNHLLSVFPLLSSKQCHFTAVFLVRKEQGIGFVSSLKVPADELVDQYLNCLKWFHKVSLPALHSDEWCEGSPLCWLFLFFYLSR